MSFQSSNFIAPYVSIDKAIRFRNTLGVIVGGFNVCLLDSITLENKQVWISFNVEEKLVLEFSSIVEAKTASDLLRGVIDTLYPNCIAGVSEDNGSFVETFTPGPINVPNTISHGLNTEDISVALWDESTNELIYAQISNRTLTSVDVTFAANPAGAVKIIILSLSSNGQVGIQISKTLAAYNIDRLANVLVINAVYKITDISNALGLTSVGVFTGVVDTINTSKLRAINTTDGSFVEIDFLTTKIVYFHDALKGNTLIGNASSFFPTGVATNVTATNSILILDTVNKIRTIESTVDLTNCSSLEIKDSNITLANTTNSSFYGISGNYSTYTFDNIIVDHKSLIGGKAGIETLSSADNQILTSFIKTQRQAIPVLGVSITKRLFNPFTTIPAKFTLTVPSTIGIGKTLTIKDDLTNIVLVVIDNKYANTTIDFVFNTVTGAFELFDYTISSYKQNIIITSNNQTVFVDILPFKVVVTDNPKLIINGIEYNYGTNFIVSNRTITWDPIYSEFDLQTDYDVQFEIEGSGK